MPVCARGKVILVGEHSVVYGTPAVAMPLADMRIEFSGHFLPNDQPNRVEINGQDATSEAAELIALAFKLLSVEPRPVSISGQSNLIIGAGLGSSATLCVGILRTILALTGYQLNASELAAFANRMEERFHGNPSGLDAAVVASEKVIKFKRGGSPIPIQVAPICARKGRSDHWRFAIIDSGERASTKDMVELASTFFLAPENANALKEFERLTELAVHGLETGSIDDLATAMNESGSLLAKTGVLTTRLSAIIEQAKEIGCLAAKITGAGGGGCVIALLHPLGWQEQIEQLKNIYSPYSVLEAMI